MCAQYIEMDDEEYQPEDESLYPIKEDISEWLNTIMVKIYQRDPKTVSDSRNIIQMGEVTGLYHHRRVIHKEPSPDHSWREIMLQILYLGVGSVAETKKKRSFVSVGSCQNLFKVELLYLCTGENQRYLENYCHAPGFRSTDCLKEMPVPQLIRLEEAIDFEQENDHEILRRIGSPDDELSYVPPSSNRQKRKKALQLDNEVHKIVDNSKFRGSIDIERMGEGRYRIHDKLVFIRMLREKHVMVRVGGGWDSLQHYLDTHEVARARSAYKLLSFTEVLQENGTPSSRERKFHQYRTRIPLRTKQS